MEEFRNNINGSGKLSSIMKEMKARIDAHFGFESNLHIIIRFVILRLIIKKPEKGQHEEAVLTYTRVLDKL